MPFNPNPLEPWRAVRGESARDTRWGSPAPGPWRGSPRTPPTPGLRADLLLLAVLLFNLALVGAVALKKFSISHAPQVGSVFGLMALGLWLGISGARNRHGLLRLSVVAVAVGLSVAAWLFIPTTGGLSWWAAQHEAMRLRAELESLRPGDSGRFQENEEARSRLVAQFPEYKDLFPQAEAAWLAKSAWKWEEEVNALPAGDLAGLEASRRSYHAFPSQRPREAERAWFERTYQGLAAGDWQTAARLRKLAAGADDLSEAARSGEVQWIARTAEEALAQSDPLFRSDPVRASAQLQQVTRALGPFEPPEATRLTLATARRRAALACLELTRTRVRAAVEEDRFQTAAAEARRVRDQMQEEARALGLTGELRQLVEGCEFLADLARAAGKSDPP